MNSILSIKSPAESIAQVRKADYDESNHGISNVRLAYWNLATEALTDCQLAVKLPKLHNQVADKPTPPLLPVLAQAVELVLRCRHGLELATHQIQKVNSVCLVAQKQIPECRHHHRRESSLNQPRPI